MADEKLTPTEDVAERIGSAIDGQIFRLMEEDKILAKASERRTEIAAVLAELNAEKARIDGRRKKPAPPPSDDKAAAARVVAP